MKVYKYNERTMTYESIPVGMYVVLSVLLILLMSISKSNGTHEYVHDSEAIVLDADKDIFSVEKLRQEIDDCGIRFGDIVLAQAILETGMFRSKIFIESNNLFGMKVARSRNTTATGENRGHAMYDNWRRSVQDYSLYQSTYLRKVRTRDQYFRYLSEYYAEDPMYVEKLKKMIKKI